MADSITFRLEDAVVLARLRQIAARVDNMAPAMRSIGKVLAESTQQRFSDSTGPNGQRWKPLAMATVLARLAEISGEFSAYTNLKTRKEGQVRTGDKAGYFNKDGKLSKKAANKVANFRPLIDTGILQDSILYQVAGGGNSVAIGTNRFAPEWEGGAAVHQFGNKKGTIPARPFLGVSDSDRAEVLEILDRFMQQSLGR